MNVNPLWVNEMISPPDKFISSLRTVKEEMRNEENDKFSLWHLVWVIKWVSLTHFMEDKKGTVLRNLCIFNHH